MAKWNKEKGIFEHEPRKFRQFPLEEVREPELFRHIYPFSQVCRVDFDHKVLPIQPAREMFITDSTFRDGQQARPPYTPGQIETLYELLHKLGGPKGIIRQSEFFLYSKKDKEAVERCLAKGYRFPQVTGWIRAAKEELNLVKEMGLKETGILTSVSDYHIFLKLNKTRKEAWEDYLEVVSLALELGIIPRCHFEDITRADIYGFCIPFALELMRLREESKTDVKIRLCDTLGFGVTYPGAALPRSVDKLVRVMIEEAGVPGELLEWHGHNDFHKVLVNATTAWLYGCAGANGTLLGFGERTGNPPLEGLVIEYITLRGEDNGLNTPVITEIAHYFEKELKAHIPSNYPFVGAEFNATKAGIHADGLLKDQEIYNIFDTAKILNRPPIVTITDKSGLAGIAYWINTHLRLPEGKGVDKRHPGIAKIHNWILEQYEKGRSIPISHEEMERLARKYLPELFVSEFERIKARAYELAAHLIEEIVEHPGMKSMDPQRQEPLVKELVDKIPFIQYAYVTNMEGRKTIRNITQLEDKAKFDARFGWDIDFSDRDWFIGPLKDGKVHVTNLYTSKVTGALCLTVSAPIRDEKENIVGILGIDIKFEELSKIEEVEE